MMLMDYLTTKLYRDMDMLIMTRVVFASLILVALVSGNEESRYAICDEENSDNVNNIIKSTVDRLMELRYPSWGWVNTPRVVLGLQLSAQEDFFARDKAIKQMETEVKNELDSMNIGKLALYVLAAKSTCVNPRNFAGKNLVRILDVRSRAQFQYNGSVQLIPYDRYYRFGLTLGALCVSGYPARNWILRRILDGQQSDGSFGGLHSVDAAAQMLLAFSCIQTENRPRYLMRRLTNATVKLISFLKSKVTTEGDDVWIGNKFSSPASALGLLEADDESPQKWRCRDVMKSLAIDPEPLDNEGAFSQRLPTLAGVNYLALQRLDWECLNTVPIPEGYQPTCNPKVPPTCNPTQPTSASQSLIEVRLTIYTFPPPSAGGTPDADVSIKVRNGSTLYDTMVVARDAGQITFETRTRSWGQSIISMQGVVANSEAREFWALLNASTQESLGRGISGYVPADGEQIEIRIKTW